VDHTVLTNFYIRATIIADLVVRHDVRDRSATARIDVLGNVALAAGATDGHWLTIHRNVHHGLLVTVPCRGRAREEKDMHLRCDWEWGKLVYHHWVRVWPIVEGIELGNVDEWRVGGAGGGHGLIWGDTSVLAEAWTSFRRAVSDFRASSVARVLGWCGIHLLMIVSTMNIVRREVSTCAL